jgi:hypothetical protein
MITRRLVLLMLAAACCLAPSGAVAGSRAPATVTLRPVEDVSFPFWCDWGYDWDERCYRDDSDRLPIGGDTDKAWRAGLRFSLAVIPRGSAILEATLSVHHDGTCLGPLKTSRPCSPRSYAIDLHQIFSADWYSEREVEYGWWALASAGLPDATRSAWLSWDVTELVDEWVAGRTWNSGVLLKLSGGEEDFDVSGPKVPSSTFANPVVRPALEVTYLPPG